MVTLTFDSIPASPRFRKPVRKVLRAPAQAVAMHAPAELGAARRFPPATLALVGVIVALHAGVVLSLAGGRSPVAAVPAVVPVTISFVAPRAEPPPPPPAKPQAPAPRPKFVTPRVAAARAAPAPVVASDTALVAATADTVQVARTPVEAAPEIAAAPPKAEEPVTEPRGYAGYLRNPAPDYPPAAQKRGLEGKVVLKVHVLASGQPDNVSVAKSSGHQVLDDAALKAVTQWAFAPARRGQTAIDGWVQVPLTFKI